MWVKLMARLEAPLKSVVLEGAAEFYKTLLRTFCSSSRWLDSFAEKEPP